MALRNTAALLLSSVILLLSGCVGKPDTLQLQIGDHRFVVEVADTEEQRTLGLMHREQLAADGGMLFVFPDAQQRSFWMKNTLIPLSIAYISSRGEILEIYDMTPLSLEPVPSRYPALYALEVNQGRFRELGIRAGAIVSGLPEPAKQ